MCGSPLASCARRTKTQPTSPEYPCSQAPVSPPLPPALYPSLSKPAPLLPAVIASSIPAPAPESPSPPPPDCPCSQATVMPPAFTTVSEHATRVASVAGKVPSHTPHQELPSLPSRLPEPLRQHQGCLRRTVGCITRPRADKAFQRGHIDGWPGAVKGI